MDEAINNEGDGAASGQPAGRVSGRGSQPVPLAAGFHVLRVGLVVLPGVPLGWALVRSAVISRDEDRG